MWIEKRRVRGEIKNFSFFDLNNDWKYFFDGSFSFKWLFLVLCKFFAVSPRNVSSQPNTFCTVFFVSLPLALARVFCTLSSPRIEVPDNRARRSLSNGLVTKSRSFDTSGTRRRLWFDTSWRVGRVVSLWRSSGYRTWRSCTKKRGPVRP